MKSPVSNFMNINFSHQRCIFMSNILLGKLIVDGCLRSVSMKIKESKLFEHIDSF